MLLSALSVACRGDRAWRLGVVPKGASSTFWQSVYAGAVMAGDDFEGEILWESPQEETDVERQIEIVQSLIGRAVDGIVLAPSDRDGLVPVVEQANEAGIPVTIFDSGIGTDQYVSYVATDNRAAGELAAEKVADLLENTGNVAMVRHVPGSDSTDERERGFAEAIAQRFSGIRIAASAYCMSYRDRAFEVSRDMLNAHADLGALFCSSEAATVGAMRALRALGQEGRVKLVGFDSAFGLQQGLRDGVVDALVVQDPFYIGYAGVKTLVQKLSGVEPPRQIDSPARLITARNLDDPDIERLLNPRNVAER